MAKAKTDVYAQRRSRALKAAVKEAGVGAILISRVEDVSYLTGFEGDDSWVVIAPRLACLITDGRYGEQAQRECPNVQIHVRTGPLAAALASILKGSGVRKLGVQAEHMTLGGRDRLAGQLKSLKLVGVSDVVAISREIKDDGEVAAIRKAIDVAQRAFGALFARGRKWFIGHTEREIAAELDYHMRLLGADKPSFDTIVAAGSNGSLPHYRPADRRVEAGDAVLIDWGAMVGGYCSDLTRVVFTGRIPAKLVEVYTIVAKAQLAGIAAVKAGAAAKTVDAAARQVIVQAGYGPQFIHGLGHGIGRQIHELPGVGQASKNRLRAGMVVTVEPGIYLPGIGGVRIEDDVLVAPTGPRKLSSLSTALADMALR